MPRLLLVANPAASGFTGSVYREVLAELGERFDVEPTWPANSEGARDAARQAAADGWDAVVAIGGDGVVHHVANGIAGTSTALGIVPAGTTNVLARILGLPGKVPAAVQRIATGRARELTTARVNADGIVNYGLFSVGMGFDADVVAAAEREPTRKIGFGAGHYARAALGVLWSRYRNRTPSLRVTVGGETTWASTALIQVLDPYTYFGRIPLRLARDRAGLTVASMEDVSPRRAPGLVRRAITGRALGRAKGVVVKSQVDHIEILCDDGTALQADGELLGRPQKVIVTPAPGALRVIT